MSSQKVIELTQQELEDIKDEVKFRTTVLIGLKELKGMPKKVWNLGVQVGLQWILLVAIIIRVALR